MTEPYGEQPVDPGPSNVPPYGQQPYPYTQPYGQPSGYPQQPPPAYPPGYGQQPYYPQPPYGANPYAPYPQAPSTNGFAIASMVLGIVWIYWIGSVLALIFGYLALGQIKRDNSNGRGMAIAGIVLGWIGIAMLVLVIILVAASNDSSSYNGLIAPLLAT